MIGHRRRLAQPGAGRRRGGARRRDGARHAGCASRSPPGSTDDVRHRRGGDRRRDRRGRRRRRVVVLMDLGSAVLSAELALDLVDPDVRERAVLCPAPLVEGLVVAAVAAAGGAARPRSPPRRSASLAGEAVPRRRAHRGGRRRYSTRGSTVPRPPPAGNESAVVKITNRARPARPPGGPPRAGGAAVRRAGSSCATSTPEPVRSPATQPVARGHARRAVRAPRRGDGHRQPGARGRRPRRRARRPPLRRAGTQPTCPLPPAAPPANGGRCPPRRASRSARRCSVPVGDVDVAGRAVRGPRRPSGGGSARAVAEVRREIQRVKAVAAPRGRRRATRRIFDAHLMLLDDADLLDDVHDADPRRAAAAPRAWLDAVAAVEAELRRAARPLPARPGRRRTRRRAAGGARPRRRRRALHIDGDGVLVADDLTPAQVADLDADPGPGRGARRRAARPATAPSWPGPAASRPSWPRDLRVLAVPDGTTIALDGTTGQVFVDPRRRHRCAASESSTSAPGPRAARALETRAHRRPSRLTASRSRSRPTSAPSTTPQSAALHGADLAGLVRTEFLYLDRARRTRPSRSRSQVYRRWPRRWAGGR